MNTELASLTKTTFILEQNLVVFGQLVPDFPNGIKSAFNDLISVLPKDEQRTFYGLSHCEGEKIIYYATAEERIPGESKKYNFKTFTIEAGDYLKIEITDWMNKLSMIKEAFTALMQDERIAPDTKPCIEWYKNDHEMTCMMKMK